MSIYRGDKFLDLGSSCENRKEQTALGERLGDGIISDMRLKEAGGPQDNLMSRCEQFHRVLGFYGRDKNQDRKQLREGVSLCLQLQVHHKGEVAHELNAGTWRQGLK